MVGLVVIILVVFALIIFLAPSKGSVGEARVNRKLTKLSNVNYHILKDVLIQTSKGTSQIDHIVVSRNGLFVIETKNYKGWIHGSDKSEYWTQTIYSHKNKFRNPVKQNWSHIYALKELLSDVGEIEYFPIVVFAGSAELKNVYSSMPVIYQSELQNEIAKVHSRYPLSDHKMAIIVDRLTKATLLGKRPKREHIRGVKSATQERRSVTDPRTPPPIKRKVS